MKLFHLFHSKIGVFGPLLISLFIPTWAIAQAHSYKQQSLVIDLGHPIKVAPLEMAFGGGVDGHEEQEQKGMLSAKNIKAMKSSGLKPLSYRLRTELGIEAWHWNPHGTWSDPYHQQGYWTSATTSPTPIITSFGYRLPRRGNTLDEANNDGYSRLDDGNPATFWKSNPYLTSYYTGEADCEHPQWVLVDFGKRQNINAICLHWKDPYARSFRVQYALGGSLYRGNNRSWHDFPYGKITKGKGGEEFLYLGQPTVFGVPKPIQFIRILMTESSGSAPKGSCDPRDAMGYALGEIEIGELKTDGYFEDHVIHRPDTSQTMIYVSSTDLWHRACDLDPKTTQPGIDKIILSGLTQNLRTLWAIPILYDTPENAAALANYLSQKSTRPLTKLATGAAEQRATTLCGSAVELCRGSTAPWFELGEEPDGQRVDPKDVAELYAQVAKKIHTTSPTAVLGGLSFVTIDEEPHDTTYRYDHRPWLKRFFQQLRKRGEEKDFRFLTFEWYPFDDFQLPAPLLLLHQPERLHKAVTRLRHGGIPVSMPLMISEYGYSVFPGEPEVTMAAALLNAEIAAQFLELGGTTSYLYGYEPGRLECAFGNSWGNLMMFLNNLSGKNGPIPLPTYYAAKLVTQYWAGAQNRPCELYPVRTSFSKKTPFVTAYFLHSPNGESSLLIINKNPTQGYQLHCRFAHAPSALWKGPLEVYSYSSAQYEWLSAGPHGHPLRNQPPSHYCLRDPKAPLSVAPWSITVVKGE